MITVEQLHEWFIYDGETGEFYWKKRPSNAVKAGDVAGYVGTPGGVLQRRSLSLRGKRLLCSRAAYMMVHGAIPRGALIDHRDGDTLNDRIDNLRLAGYAQNAWNKMGAGGSRLVGVSKTERGRFKARISSPDGSKINLGTWDTEAEAHAAYMGAAAVMHGEFWTGASRMELGHRTK